MKITKTRLKQIIQEELAKVLNEDIPSDLQRAADDAFSDFDDMDFDDPPEPSRSKPAAPAKKPEVAPAPAKKPAVGTKLTPPQGKKQFLEYLNRYFAAIKKLGPAPQREAYPGGMKGMQEYLNAKDDYFQARRVTAENHHIKDARLIRKDDPKRGLTKGQVEYVSSDESGNMTIYHRKQ